MAIGKEHRKSVIRIFSNHCKINGWGKIYASERLSEYIYPLLNKNNLERRAEFVRNWQDTLETVINKPTKTTLSRPKNIELFDYIDAYTSDILADEYLPLNGLDFYDNVVSFVQSSQSFEGMNTSKYQSEIENNIYLISNPITSSHFENSNELLGYSFKLLDYSSEFFAIKNHGSGVYKCCYFFPNAQSESIDKNRRFLRGAIYSKKVGDGEEFFGLIVDEIRRKISSVRLADSGSITQSSYTYSFPRGDGKSFSNFMLKIENESNFFTKYVANQKDMMFFRGDIALCHLHELRKDSKVSRVKSISLDIKNSFDKLKLI